MTGQPNRRSSFATMTGSAVVLTMGVLLLLGTGVLGAQELPTGYQDYFVLGLEQHVWGMLQKVRDGQGTGDFDDGINP